MINSTTMRARVRSALLLSAALAAPCALDAQTVAPPAAPLNDTDCDFNQSNPTLAVPPCTVDGTRTVTYNGRTRQVRNASSDYLIDNYSVNFSGNLKVDGAPVVLASGNFQFPNTSTNAVTGPIDIGNYISSAGQTVNVTASYTGLKYQTVATGSTGAAAVTNPAYFSQISELSGTVNSIAIDIADTLSTSDGGSYDYTLTSVNPTAITDNATALSGAFHGNAGSGALQFGRLDGTASVTGNANAYTVTPYPAETGAYNTGTSSLYSLGYAVTATVTTQLDETGLITPKIAVTDGIAMNGSTITGLGAPVTATDAATKGYVDSAVAGISGGGSASPYVKVNSTGLGANANGSDAIAIGLNSSSSGDESTGIGVLANAGGNDSVALGARANASAIRSVSVGREAAATNFESLALGSQAKAGGQSAIAAGARAIASQQASSSFGEAASASAFLATALGAESNAAGYGSTAVGAGTQATGDRSVAVGSSDAYYNTQTVASGSFSTAIGAQSRATHTNSVAIGANSATDRSDSVAFGNRQLTAVAAGTAATDAVNKAQLDAAIAGVSGGSGGGSAYLAVTTAKTPASATGSESLAVGGGATASAAGTVAVGSGAEAIASGAFAAGGGARAYGVNTLAFGTAATASGPDSSAIGNNAYANAQAATAIGTGAAATGLQSLSFGQGAQALAERAVSIGQGSIANQLAGTALGQGAQATGEYATSSGQNAVASASLATATGARANATAANATALGAAAKATYANSTAVGAGAQTTAANQVMLGSSGTAVVVADINSSTAAQQGPVNVVTVDANGVLGKQAVATTADVRTAVEYISAVTDSQFSDLSGRVSALQGRMDSFDLRLTGVEGGVAAAMAMGQAKLVPDANISMTVAAATYGGQQGFAGSLSGRVGEKVYVSGSVSGNTGDKRVGGAVSATVGF